MKAVMAVVVVVVVKASEARRSTKRGLMVGRVRVCASSVSSVSFVPSIHIQTIYRVVRPYRSSSHNSIGLGWALLKWFAFPTPGFSHVHPRASSKETSPMVSYVAGCGNWTQVWVAAVVSTVSIYPVF